MENKLDHWELEKTFVMAHEWEKTKVAKLKIAHLITNLLKDAVLVTSAKTLLILKKAESLNGQRIIIEFQGKNVKGFERSISLNIEGMLNSIQKGLITVYDGQSLKQEKHERRTFNF